ncbi:Gfo/Idh/MocA family protein [Sphingomonas sp. ac-8]|uniref:Gfo/Idh/MocA family protein n=1 Tax=Sphingomonas sp. ac-8 TaxID=3242977 RepID=UPI003A80D043
MPAQPIRIGFIGLNPDAHWAAAAHLPALRVLANQFEIVGVSNSSAQSAQRTKDALGLKHAFASADELVASPEVDLVVVTVKVPHHLELVRKAIAAGKHVHCEWPLGNGLAEAEELAALAGEKRVVATVGTQARSAPEILYLRKLIADGYVGDVLSTSVIASGGNWGDRTTEDLRYLYDRVNGATMLTIPMGHFLAAMRDVLGDVAEIDARLDIRRPEVTVEPTGERFTRSAADQIMAFGTLKRGGSLSLHYRGGMTPGTNFLWTIEGSAGVIEVTGANGHTQMVQLSLRGATGDDGALQDITVPPDYGAGLPDAQPARNVAAVYARIAEDIRTGSRTAPSFDDAVALHRVIGRIGQAAG